MTVGHPIKPPPGHERKGQPATSARVVTAVFLAHLPRFERRARFAFRRVRCPHDRAEKVAEAVALAWTHFAELSIRGKRPETFVTTLALRSAQAVKAGRRAASRPRRCSRRWPRSGTGSPCAGCRSANRCRTTRRCRAR